MNTQRIKITLLKLVIFFGQNILSCTLFFFYSSVLSVSTNKIKVTNRNKYRQFLAPKFPAPRPSRVFVVSV